MYIYRADTKNDFLCKIVLKSGSLKSCPRARIPHVRRSVIKWYRQCWGDHVLQNRSSYAVSVNSRI